MKPTSISIPAIAIVAAGTLCTIGTVRAQTDTSIGSNPHLRSQSAPGQSPGTEVVKLSQKDVNFIQKAAGGGQQEVENGKLAEKQGKSRDERDLKSWAAKTLPMLKEHLAMVQNVMKTAR